MHKLNWSKTAINSYNRLTFRTKKFENKLDKTLNTIVSFPTSFPIDEVFNIYRAVISKRCILYYQIKNGNIYLTLFFDTKMDVVNLKRLL